MNRIIEYKIDPKAIITILDMARKMKIFSVVCQPIEQGITMSGFSMDFGLMKKICDVKLSSIFIPIPFAVLTNNLILLEKAILEEGINEVYVTTIASQDTTNGYPVFSFAKSIRCGTLNVPLFDYSQFFNLTCKIDSEIFRSNTLYQKDLTADEEFINMCATKSDDGISKLRIGEHLVFVMPSMLNVLKGDEVSVDIRSADVGKLVVFTVNKPKKKCTVYVIYRMLDIRK